MLPVMDILLLWLPAYAAESGCCFLPGLIPLCHAVVSGYTSEENMPFVRLMEPSDQFSAALYAHEVSLWAPQVLGELLQGFASVHLCTDL